jgi:hypothetical protein
MRKLQLLTAGALACALLSAPLAASAASGTISGTVHEVDPSAAAAPFLVTLVAADGTTYTTTTDLRGRYAFVSVPSGKAMLQTDFGCTATVGLAGDVHAIVDLWGSHSGNAVRQPWACPQEGDQIAPGITSDLYVVR